MIRWRWTAGLMVAAMSVGLMMPWDRAAAMATEPADPAAAPADTVMPSALPLQPAAAAAEVQVPVDRRGHVDRIDRDLAERIGLSSGHPDFHEARLFQRADSSYVLEITTLTAGRLARERVPYTASQVDALREQVSGALGSRDAIGSPAQPGRPLFATMSTVMGLAFYGWAVPVLADVSDASAFTGVYLVTAGASTLLPLLATTDRPISDASAILWTYGTTRGVAHGAAIPYLSDDHPEGQTQLGWALGLSLAEGVAGFAWAGRSGMSAGSAGTYVTGGDFGALYGLGIADIMHAGHSGLTSGMLIGTGVGLASAAALNPHRSYSYGDGAVMRMSGWLGGFAGLTVANLVDRDPMRLLAVGFSLAGSVIGLAAGDRLVRDTEFTFGQSVVIDFTAIAGGLMGLGVGLIAVSDGSDENDGAILLASSSVGSILGYALGYGLNVSNAKFANTNRSSWRLDLSPTPPLARGDAPGVRLALSTGLSPAD